MPEEAIESLKEWEERYIKFLSEVQRDREGHKYFGEDVKPEEWPKLESLLNEQERQIRLRLKLIPKAVNETKIPPEKIDPILIALIRCRDIDHYGLTMKEARRLANNVITLRVFTDLEDALTPFFQKYVSYGYSEKGGTPFEDRIALSFVTLVELFKRFSMDKKPHHILVTSIIFELFPAFKEKQLKLRGLAGFPDAGTTARMEKRVFTDVSKKKYHAHKDRFFQALDDLLNTLNEYSIQRWQ